MVTICGVSKSAKSPESPSRISEPDATSNRLLELIRKSMRSLMLSMISMAVLTIETAADKGPNLVPAQPATAPNY